jgi:hypothetical protein
MASNNLANQLGKTHLPTRKYTCAIPVGTISPTCHARWEGEKIKNREGFPMKVFKRWKGINIILFFSQEVGFEF